MSRISVPGLVGASLALGLVSFAFAAAPPGYPPPGEYRIDSDAVTRTGSGPTALEQRTQTDGATGTVTTTSRAADGAANTQVYKGSKPVTWCVRPATAADVPRDSPFACRTSNAQTTATSSSFTAACKSAALENSFRVIDDRHWEHVMTFELRADRTPANSARDLIARALPGMTPAERAEAQKALAELPTQDAMDRQNTELLRQAEEDVRTAPNPEEANAARQALQALRGALQGTAVQKTMRVVERWTLLGSTCAPAR